MLSINLKKSKSNTKFTSIYMPDVKIVDHMNNIEDINFTGVVKDSQNTFAFYENGILNKEAVIEITNDQCDYFCFIGGMRYISLVDPVDLREFTGSYIDDCFENHLKNGKLHREDGPAIKAIHKSWSLISKIKVGWFFNGVEVSVNDDSFSKEKMEKYINLHIFK